MREGGDRVGRLATLAAIAGVASVAAASLVMSSIDSRPLALVLALALGVALTLGVLLAGRRWSRPVKSEGERAERKHEPAPEQRPDAAAADPARLDVVNKPAASLIPLYEVGLRSGLRQAALTFETVAEIAPGDPNLRMLRAIGYGAAIRAQELVARLERGPELARGAPATLAFNAVDLRREPFPLREDIATMARALSFEAGREVALRFGSNFPAQAQGDRTLFRLALTALFHAALEHGADSAEILIEASHEELAPPHAHARIAVSASGELTIAHLPRYDSLLRPETTAALQGLARLLELEGGNLYLGASDLQLAFSLPVIRYKRLTGTTLYGLGALSDRAVLVVDPRPIGRVTICEQLAAWTLSPTGVASLDEALAAATKARQRGQRFDLVVVSGFMREQHARILEIVRSMPAYQYAKLLSLEDIETGSAALPLELASAPGVVLRRMPRPPSPSELIEILTTLLAPAPVPRSATRKGPGLSLLLAEDNAVNQALMVKMLERRGHSVQVVGNGADLVDHLSEAPGEYDAVLMDIQMPVMDGYEATAVIRLREAQSQRPRIPIIAVTAHAMGGERERCIEAGMDGYLPKPVVDKDLGAALEQVSRPRPQEAVRPAAANGVFDREHVLDLASGDMAFLNGLVEIFGHSAPRLVDQLATQLAESDHQAAYRSAHQLKGSIGNFGAKRAYGRASTVEELAKRGDVAAASALLPDLRADVNELVAGLQALAREVASPVS